MSYEAGRDLVAADIEGLMEGAGVNVGKDIESIIQRSGDIHLNLSREDIAKVMVWEHRKTRLELELQVVRLEQELKLQRVVMALLLGFALVILILMIAQTASMRPAFVFLMRGIFYLLL